MQMVRNIHYPQDQSIYPSILSNPVLRLHVVYVILFGSIVLISNILMSSIAALSISNAIVAHIWPVSLCYEALVQIYRLNVASQDNPCGYVISVSGLFLCTQLD
jgi:uncharacterized membrane protein YdfJ with MMPL/SSD domain